MPPDVRSPQPAPETPDHRPGSAASRRAVLASAAAVGTTAAVGTVGLSPAAAALPLVAPRTSQSVFARVGVNVLPNHIGTGYDYRSAWMATLGDLGTPYFRGFYEPRQSLTMDVVRRARSRKLRWGMSIATDSWVSADRIRNTIRHIADNAADVCLYVEGVNEPNWDRARAYEPSGWIARTAAQQRAIWQAVRADRRLDHVKVLGPSLRDISASESDYRALAQQGILANVSHAALHRYPNGTYPDQFLDQRFAMLRRQWPGKPVWITETGYQNALANTSGHKPVPEWVAAAYMPSAVLEAIDRGAAGVCFFELLDDPDRGAKNDTEANFGLYRSRDTVGPPWSAKPAATQLRAFLRSLVDPGPEFTPARVPLRVTSSASDLRWTLTARRNGVATLHVRRATDCWDNNAQRPISVARVPVRVETARGVRTLQVDHQVQSITL